MIEAYHQMHPQVIATRAALLRTGPPADAVAHVLARIVERKSHRLRYPVGKQKWDVMWKNFLPEAVFEWFARRTFRLD